MDLRWFFLAYLAAHHCVQAILSPPEKRRLYRQFRNGEYTDVYNALKNDGYTEQIDSIEGFEAFVEPHYPVTHKDLSNEALKKWAYDHRLINVPYHGHTTRWHVLYTFQAIIQTYLSIIATRYFLSRHSLAGKVIETLFAFLWFFPLFVNPYLIRHNAIQALKRQPPTPPFGRPLIEAFQTNANTIKCVGTGYAISRRLIDACNMIGIEPVYDPCSTSSDHVHCNRYSKMRGYECGRCLAPLIWERQDQRER